MGGPGEGRGGDLTNDCVAPGHDGVDDSVRVDAVGEPGRHALSHQTTECRPWTQGQVKNITMVRANHPGIPILYITTLGQVNTHKA